MPPKVIPPRLHVLIASEAPYAVVLRRWPSKETTTFGWDLTTDTLTYGQWMKAQTYEEMCDLSPDGKHLLYFANDKRSEKPPYFGVSRAPYLKALGFYEWNQGFSSGGHWVDNKTFWLRGHPHVIREDHKLTRIEEPKGYTHSWSYRLIRDGWIRLAEEVRVHRPNNLPFGVGTLDHQQLFLEFFFKLTGKRIAWFTARQFAKVIHRNWVLIRVIQNPDDKHPRHGQFWEAYGLVNKLSKCQIFKPDWEWADYDAPRDRILFAENGKIFAVKLTNEALGEPVELFDSTQYGRDPVIAPY